jgi:flavin reductase (DIM6/NTAB) family NADH-FMN oxidoreductase RutF
MPPPALDTRALRNTLGSFPTGVTVITALARDGRPLGITVNSFASVSLLPPLVLWSQARTSPTHDEFASAATMVINILADDQQEVSAHFARPTLDKFAGIAFSRLPCGTPVLDGSSATLVCTPTARYDGGDHTIHLCAVDTFTNHHRPPLIFCRGSYLVPGALQA